MSIPVRSHVVIGVFLVLAMVYHPGHARASSDPVKKWMVADWEISKLTDSCIGRASSMVSGSTTLFFSAAHNGISAFITNPKWKITSKEKTNVDVWIDAKIVGGTEARAFDAITVEIAIPSSLVAKFQDGDVVELDFGRAKYSFPLPYSRKGLKALLECGASYQRKDGGQVTNDEGSTITRGYKSVDEAFRARLKCSKYNINHVPVSKVTWEPTNYSDQEFKNCVRSKSTQDNLRFDIGVFDAIINLNCRYTEMDKGISPEKRKDLGFLRRAAVFGLISRIKAGADVDSELDLFNVNDVSAQELYLNEMTKNAVKSEQSAEACIHGRISRFAAAQSAKDAAEVAVDLCAPQIRRQVETQCSCLNWGECSDGEKAINERMKQQKDKYALDWAARYMEKRSELALQSPDTHQSQQSSFKTSQEIFALASQYVFVVIATGSQDIAQGSAVAISPFELITNCHVVSGRSVIALYSGGNGIEAEVKHEDITGDRCTIRTKTPLSHFAEIRSFSSVEIGEKVYSIGSPHGLDLGLGLTMADGIISGKRADGVNRYLQTTAAISKGSSGGGLFDSAGRLVGVTTFTLNDGQNLNFAVPAEDYEK